VCGYKSISLTAESATADTSASGTICIGKRLHNWGVTGRIGGSAVVDGKYKRPMPFGPRQERGEKKASTQRHVASTTIDCQTRRAPSPMLARKAYNSVVKLEDGASAHQDSEDFFLRSYPTQKKKTKIVNLCW